MGGLTAAEHFGWCWFGGMEGDGVVEGWEVLGWLWRELMENDGGGRIGLMSD